MDSALNVIFELQNGSRIVYEIIAAILHLCNLEFLEDSNQHAFIHDGISSRESLEFVAKILQIESTELIDTVTNRKIQSHSDQIM